MPAHGEKCYKATVYETTRLLAKEFDLKDPYQLEIRVPGGRAKVVGIVKDFNFKSLHTKIEPIAIIYLPRQGQW